MELNEIITELIRKGYILPAGDRYIFTTQFYKDLKKEDYPDVRKAQYDAYRLMARKVKQEMIKQGWKAPDENLQAKTGMLENVDGKTAYIQFIKDCKIPNRAQSGTGFVYELNQYSEDGCKAFEKLMKEDIDYNILVQATSIYYSSPIYKQKVGNYITQGTWRTYYDRLVAAKANGSTDKMIRSETSSGRSKYD